MKPAKYHHEDDLPGKRNCLDKDGHLVEDDGFITLYPPVAAPVEDRRAARPIR